MKKPSLTEQLSAGVPQLLTHIKVRRDWHYCPRCGERKVSRDRRRCLGCNGRLLFSGDTGNDVHGSPIIDKQGASADWFMWKRSIFGFEGWYHRTFFTQTPLADTNPSGYL